MSKEREKGMSIIVKTVTRLTVGLIILYGVYILTHGHVSPGGGFAGGVIIALSFVHMMLAFGKETALSKLSKGRTTLFEGLGAIIFLGVALLGFTEGYFFLNFMSKGEPYKLFSAGIIPICNLAISLKVGAGLFAIFVVLILLKLDVEEKE